MGRGSQDGLPGAAAVREPRLPAPGRLSEEELEVIDAWCGDEVPYLVNSYLRTGRPEHATTASDEQAAQLARWYVERLDRLFERAPRLRRELVVYRGLAAGVMVDTGSQDEVPERGYAAASLEPERAAVFAEGGRVLELRLPAGTPVVAIDGIEGLQRYRHEREVLLPRGGSYRITGQAPDGLVRAEFMPPAR